MATSKSTKKKFSVFAEVRLQLVRAIEADSLADAAAIATSDVKTSDYVDLDAIRRKGVEINDYETNVEGVHKY